MALKIRLRQQGRRNKPFYRMVVTESRARRDGKYIECIGWYNPSEKEDDKLVSVKPDRLQHWLDAGAEMTEKVEHLAVRAANGVVKSFKEKAIAKQAKEAAKRKQRKKKAAA